MIRYTRPGYSTGSIALSVLAIVYAGLLLSFLVNLRLLNGNRWGMAALLSLIVIVKLSDTGAYFVGRRFGTHKLAPRLSPGKTIEGTAGGLATACGGAWVCLCLDGAIARGPGRRSGAPLGLVALRPGDHALWHAGGPGRILAQTGRSAQGLQPMATRPGRSPRCPGFHCFRSRSGIRFFRVGADRATLDDETHVRLR